MTVYWYILQTSRFDALIVLHYLYFFLWFYLLVCTQFGYFCYFVVLNNSMRSVLIHKCCVHVSDYFLRIELKNWHCWVKDYKQMFVLDFVLKVKYKEIHFKVCGSHSFLFYTLSSLPQTPLFIKMLCLWSSCYETATLFFFD